MTDCSADPLISIALCTYNGAAYLGEQLDSLLAQTYSNIEIVVVDDASTDSTVDMLDSYASRDRRLKVFVNDRNVGFRRNFERALASCSGEFIAPCDQDDIWLPHKLRQLHGVLGSYAMAYCDSELVDSEGRSLGVFMSDTRRMQNITDVAAFVLENCVSGHAMLFRRELLEAALPIPEGFFHDWWVAAVAAAHGEIVYCPEKLVLYRQHASNVTDVLRGRTERLPGFGVRRLMEIGKRIDSLECLAGAHQEMIGALNKLWKARDRQWVSFPLGFFVLLHRRQLFSLRKYSKVRSLRRAMAFFIGLRLKRITNKYKYTLPPE